MAISRTHPDRGRDKDEAQKITHAWDVIKATFPSDYCDVNLCDDDEETGDVNNVGNDTNETNNEGNNEGNNLNDDTTEEEKSVGDGKSNNEGDNVSDNTAEGEGSEAASKRQKTDATNKPTSNKRNEERDAESAEEESEEGEKEVVDDIISIMNGLNEPKCRDMRHATGFKGEAEYSCAETYSKYRQLPKEERDNVRKTLNAGEFKNQNHKTLAFLEIIGPGCSPEATADDKPKCKALMMLASVSNNLTSTGETPFYTSNGGDEIEEDEVVARFWLTNPEEHRILLPLLQKMGLSFAGKTRWKQKCNVVKVYRDSKISENLKNKIQKELERKSGAKKSAKASTATAKGKLECVRVLQ